MKLKHLGITWAFALALVSTPLSGLAQNEQKYGFVNITQVITQSEEGRAEAAELESLGAEKQQELDARQQELQELVEQYEEGAEGEQPDDQLRNRIERLERELERDARQAQADVDTSRQDRIQAIGNKVVQLIRRFGQDNGYTAIFRMDGGQVVYVDPAADITDQVLDAYNNAHPVE